MELKGSKKFGRGFQTDKNLRNLSAGKYLQGDSQVVC